MAISAQAAIEKIYLEAQRKLRKIEMGKTVLYWKPAKRRDLTRQHLPTAVLSARFCVTAAGKIREDEPDEK